MSLKNKVVLITASADGIGKVIATRFAREEAKLIISDINEKELLKTKSELESMGIEVLAVQCDARKTSDIDNLFNKAISKFKTIDVLVNNAGIAGPTKPVIEMEIEDWDSTLEINLRSTFYCTKLAAPYMIKQGSGKIVNMSSQSGKKSLPNRSPYCASKMGIIGLTRCVADELGKYDITVNAVCPGAVGGKRLDGVFENQARILGITPEEYRIKFLEPSPIKRTVPPEDVAEMVIFLSDAEKSNSITGQDINVNCGTVTY